MSDSLITDTIYSHLTDICKTRVLSFKEPAVIIEPDHVISDVINKLSNTNSYSAFYLKGRSVFTTSIHALLAAKNITKMTVGSFLYSIPTLSSTGTIQNAANIMTHYRIREVPIMSKNEIVGIISAKKILQLLAKKDNKWIKSNLIYTQNPVTISSDKPLSAARKIMSSKRIDHLPVLNHKGDVQQVLTSYHLLHTIMPKEKIGRRSIGIQKRRKLESNIGNIGSTRIPQCAPNDDLNHVLNSMLKTNATCCLVNLWNDLQGIITYRDILSLLAVKMQSDIPLYIVGMPENQKKCKTDHSKIHQCTKEIAKRLF